jgi:hypothetical protein
MVVPSASAAPMCGQTALTELDSLAAGTYRVFYGADALGPNSATFGGRAVVGAMSDTDAAIVYRWNGSALVQETVQQPQGAGGAEIDDVTVLAGGQGWAAGTSVDDGLRAHAFIRRRVGGQWRVVAGPSFPGDAALDGAIDATAPTNVWIVGRRGGYANPVVLRWDGDAWSKRALPAIAGAVEHTAWGVDTLGPKNVWIAGRYLIEGSVTKNVIYRSQGDRLMRMAVPSPGAGGNELQAIAVIDGDEAWAVGTLRTAGGQDRPMFLHWDGRRWTSITSPAVTGDGVLVDATVTSNGRLLAVGYDGAGMLVIRSTAHGTSLTKVAPSGTDGELLAAGVAEGTQVVVAGGAVDGAPVAYANCA